MEHAFSHPRITRDLRRLRRAVAERRWRGAPVETTLNSAHASETACESAAFGGGRRRV